MSADPRDAISDGLDRIRDGNMLHSEKITAILAALSAAGLVVVPREIQETPIEAAFWAAEDQYKALVAANVWPRPIRAVYIWDALLAAALPAAPQEDRT